MKITFWKGKKSLHIYSKFYTNKLIVPIGSDCHCAYILNTLNIRKQSLVFDWLFSNSKTGIQYVNENIRNNFNLFLDDLTRNYRNHIVSKNYPQTEFFHEKELIQSEKDQEKIRKRAERFINIIQNNRCYLLYVINPEHFESRNDINSFIDSIIELIKITNSKHQIKIFIKCKQNLDDFSMVDQLIEQCNKVQKVKAIKYYLDTEKYGQWGNHKDFLPLLKNLGINIRRSIIPKIYID